ncbi:hypothetical protein [Pseudooctadecabacter sp.]|uniref:hypothetical protein n=1 Tax=Pseudooctadecabacter sp. TaxID=1966338 RepID=UPI0025F547AE|nr:hypothetical protein [Pseudooctadecabacter sp.]
MDTETAAENIRALIEERLRLKARSLSHGVRRAGRLLPPWARREARYLVQAAEMARHPKMQARIDDARVAKAHRDLTEYLTSIDPKEQRKTRILKVLGAVSFNLIVVVAAFITYLVWRGFV